MAFRPFYHLEPPYRVISFDGGGIYGYFTTLMLTELCKQNEDFLNGDDEVIFAGISAGALIALYLAAQESPREAILRGDLEKMFHDYRLYANIDPVSATTSLMGLSSWCSGPLMKDFVQETWGDKALGELPQRVLIETFDFTGNVDDVAKRSWKPRTFRNYGEINQATVSAAFVAYGSTAPATYRPVEDGVSDAGYFAINPMMAAIADINNLSGEEAHYWRYVVELTYALREIHESLDQMIVLALGIEDPAAYDTTRADLTAGLTYLRETVIGLIDLIDEMLTLPHDSATIQHLNELKAKLIALQNDGYFDGEYPPVLAGTEVLDQTQQGVIGLLELWAILEDFPIFQKSEDWELYWDETYKQLRANFGLDPESNGFYDVASPNPGPDQAGLLDINASSLLQNLQGLFEALAGQQPARINDIQGLSLGTGNFVPGYFQKNFDLGVLNINLLPTNLKQQAYLPPPWDLLLDPSIKSTDKQARELLGDRYFRFNPPVLKFPVPNEVLSLYISRFKPWRDYILRSMDTKAGTVEEADFVAVNKWLEEFGWNDPSDNDREQVEETLGAQA